MARVATIPLQRTMSDAIQAAQEKLAETQWRLSTYKKAPTYASLGTEAVRNLSAHSMLEQQKAQATVAKRVGTTMSLYQGQIEGVQSSIEDLHKQILTAIGTGESAGLQKTIESAFQQMRNSLNANEGGTPLFGGSQIDQPPFSVKTLAEAGSVSADDAFHDDKVLASARVADDVDVSYGINASSFGRGLYEAFRTLSKLGPISDKLTSAQTDVLKQAIGQIDKGLDSLRQVNAENGRNQQRVETLATRGDERSALFAKVIQDNEDADLGQAATDLAQQKAMLEASYMVFSQLTSLSLVKFIR